MLEFFRSNKIKAYDPYHLTFYIPTFRYSYLLQWVNMALELTLVIQYKYGGI